MVLEAELVPTFLSTGQGEAGGRLGRSLPPLMAKCLHTQSWSVPSPTLTNPCNQPTKFLICTPHLNPGTGHPLPASWGNGGPQSHV